MKTILVALLPLLAPVAPANDFAAPEPVPVAAICIDNDSQRPMMGDPHGPPTLCQMKIGIRFLLEHGSCGSSCNTHIPVDPAAEPPGIPVRLGLSCPAGQNVEGLSYQVMGQQEIFLVDGDTGSSTYTQSLEVNPFSKAELAAACERALGGRWLPGGSHSNLAEKVETTLKKSINVRGKCAFEPRQKKYQVSLGVLCIDRDFSLDWAPPG